VVISLNSFLLVKVIMGRPVEIADTEFDRAVLQSGTPVLVDFWGPGCRPCQMMNPALDELASEFSGRINIFKINVEESPAIASRYGVMGLPTLMVFKAGQPVDTFIGYQQKDELKRRLEDAV
jgi:thioredoxin 1